MRKAEEKKIRTALGSTTLDDMYDSINFKPKQIWAAERPNDENKAVILITLMKDVEGLSYKELKERVAPWFNQSNMSIQHNVKTGRKKLRKWAKSILKPTSRHQRQKLASTAHRASPCEDVTLWVDSTDFAISGKRSVRRKDPRWSHKLKAPGRRWMVMMDAKTRAQFIAGPYHPTVYDGHIFLRNATEIEKLFPGETCVGDTHYGTVNSAMTNFAMVAPVSAAGRPKIVEGKKAKLKLSDEEQERNDAIAGVRARVESPFGWIDRKFSALCMPFRESEDQHNCLVRTAFACHRLMKK